MEKVVKGEGEGDEHIPKDHSSNDTVCSSTSIPTFHLNGEFVFLRVRDYAVGASAAITVFKVGRDVGLGGRSVNGGE